MQRIPNNRKKQSLSKILSAWTLFWMISGDFSAVWGASAPKILEYSPEGEISATSESFDEENAPSSDDVLKFAATGSAESKAAPFSKGILPPEILDTEKEKFSPNIRKSYSPGIMLESLHFEMEGDDYWRQNAFQLAHVLRRMEEIRHEADLTASLWRQPFFTAEMRAGRVFLTPNKEQIPYRTSVPAKRMRLRVMESARSLTKPCQLEDIRGEACLTITISSIQDFQRDEFQRNIREVLFRSALHDGKEEWIFPIWLQEGLISVFAGESGWEADSSRNLLSLSELTEISEKAVKSNYSNSGPGGVRKEETSLERRLLEEDVLFKKSSALWVRYFLGANAGKTFFSFWGTLNQICAFAEKEQREYDGGEKETKMRSSDQKIAMFSPKIQREAWDRLRLLESASESGGGRIHFSSGKIAVQEFSTDKPQNFAEWRRKPDSGEIPVWESSEILVLNASVSENQPLPLQKTTEEQKEAFHEMALLLQIVSAYRKCSSENVFLHGKGGANDGVLIQEFGKPKEFRKFSTMTSGESIAENTRDNTDVNSENRKTADNPQEVTAEDLQRLEDVYAWFTSGDTAVERLFFDFNGYPVSPVLRYAETEKLFHPQKRAFLLQEFNGNPVLSATFADGSVLHVILEENDGKTNVSDNFIPKIRILGMETPEFTEAGTDSNP